MSTRFTSFAKTSLPPRAHPLARRVYREVYRVPDSVRLRRAKRCFERGPAQPEWLEAEELERLQDRFALPRSYGYDPATLERRGEERAYEISRSVPRFASVLEFLELGCHDGMVGAVLCRRGKRVSAVDLTDSLDERALRAGVAFVQADAAQLPFTDAAFDVVYSYNAFEHLARPQDALSEATRVLRVGGFLYLSFGPLYLSPFGFHAFHSISVPYCHVLFTPDVLAGFVERRGLGALATYVNGWSITDHRQLWNSFADRLDVISYAAFRDLAGLTLIAEHPSCFRSKTDAFEDLIVSRVDVVFRKRPPAP